MEQLFTLKETEGFRYPGEYMDFVRLNYGEMLTPEEMGDIAYTLASCVSKVDGYGHHRFDRRYFNEQQEWRLYDWLKTAGKNSLLCHAALMTFYKIRWNEEEEGEGVWKNQYETERDLVFQSVPSRREIFPVLTLHPNCAGLWLNELNMYMDTFSLFEDEDIIRFVKTTRKTIRADKKYHVLFRGMRKMMDGRLDDTSAEYAALDAHGLSKRQILYLNLQLLDPFKCRIMDRLAADFVVTSFVFENAVPYHEKEQMVLRENLYRPFHAQIDYESNVYSYLLRCWDMAPMTDVSGRCHISCDENWMFIYDQVKEWEKRNVNDEKGLLWFDIFAPAFSDRWNYASIFTKLSFLSANSDAHIKERYRFLKEMLNGDLERTLLNRGYCSLFLDLRKNGLVPFPKESECVEKWLAYLKNCDHVFAVRELIHAAELGYDLTFLSQEYLNDTKFLMEERILQCNWEERRKIFWIYLDCKFQDHPMEFPKFVKILIEHDYQRRTQNKQGGFDLSMFLKEDEIVELSKQVYSYGYAEPLTDSLQYWLQMDKVLGNIIRCEQDRIQEECNLQELLSFQNQLEKSVTKALDESYLYVYYNLSKRVCFSKENKPLIVAVYKELMAGISDLMIENRQLMDYVGCMKEIASKLDDHEFLFQMADRLVELKERGVLL